MCYGGCQCKRCMGPDEEDGIICKSVINRLKIQLADEIVTLEDGYKYYYPIKRGALAASILRDIADTLDALNKDWDKQVHEDLSRKEREANGSH